MQQFIKSIILGLFFFSSLVVGQESVWIDVRTLGEYSQGHVQGAENIPYDEIAEKISTFVEDKDTSIQLYCRSGARASIALKTLKGLGYKNVENRGGILNLQSEELIVK